MDKTSSEYLDKFAVERLLSDKLMKVKHKPGSLEGISVPEKLLTVPHEELNFKEEAETVTFHSPVVTPWAVNNLCCVDIYRPKKEKKGKLLFIHGLYEDNKQIYQFLFSQLMEKGYTIYLYSLPYHYGRTPEESQFSGEYFWSADMKRTVSAFMQAVTDIQHLYEFLGEPHLCGFSMGGAVLFNFLERYPVSSGVVLLNPVSDLTRQVWDSRLWMTIKEDLVNNGLDFDVVEQIYSSLSPGNIRQLKSECKNIIMVCGQYDQIVNCESTLEFPDQFKGMKREVYKCGHLNLLRVPRLSEDMDQFYKKIRGKKKDELLSKSI